MTSFLVDNYLATAGNRAALELVAAGQTQVELARQERQLEDQWGARGARGEPISARGVAGDGRLDNDAALLDACMLVC
jgi:hypothetical protein